MNAKKASGYLPSELFPVFRELIPTAALMALVRAAPTRFYWRVYSPLVLLWGFVHQFVSHDHSCDGVLDVLSSGELDAWEAAESKAWRGQEPKEPLSRRVPNHNSSYCQGRKRLPLQWLQYCVGITAQRIHREASKHWDWMGRSVRILDGTTFLTQSTPDLIEHYGRHGNQNGPGHWPVMRSVAAFDLHVGAAVALVEGTLHSSEQALAVQLFQQLADCGSWLEPDMDQAEGGTLLGSEETQQEGAVYIADRNFGVYSVVQAAVATGQDVVVRLTESRARAILKHAHSRKKAKQGAPNHMPEWNSVQDVLLRWTPTRHDQVSIAASVPEAGNGQSSLPQVNGVEGRLIKWVLERPGFRPQELLLFTTLTDCDTYSAESIVDLYAYRWQAELDFRELKDTLELTHLRAKSVDMVRKELYAGVLAYNLIRGVMLLAAVQASLAPRELSFNRCWRRLRVMMHGFPHYDPKQKEDMAARIDRLLYMLAGCRIHKRKPRIEPRGVRGRPCPYPHIKGDRMEYLAKQIAKS